MCARVVWFGVWLVWCGVVLWYVMRCAVRSGVDLDIPHPCSLHPQPPPAPTPRPPLPTTLVGHISERPPQLQPFTMLDLSARSACACPSYSPPQLHPLTILDLSARSACACPSCCLSCATSDWYSRMRPAITSAWCCATTTVPADDSSTRTCRGGGAWHWVQGCRGGMVQGMSGTS